MGVDRLPGDTPIQSIAELSGPFNGFKCTHPELCMFAKNKKHIKRTLMSKLHMKEDEALNYFESGHLVQQVFKIPGQKAYISVIPHAIHQESFRGGNDSNLINQIKVAEPKLISC